VDRRAFIGGLLASAAVRTWPFRVFSFPSEVKVPTFTEYVDFCNFTEFATGPEAMLTVKAIRQMRDHIIGLGIEPFYPEKFLTIG
jgi:hypothetical protein